MAGRPRWWAAGLLVCVGLVAGGLVWLSGHQTSVDRPGGGRQGGAPASAAVGAGSEDTRRTPLQLSGPVEVRRTPHTRVVVRGDGAEADRMSRLGVTAVRQVRRVLPGWHGRLVIQVPASQAQLERMLRVRRGTYAGIAAVTTTRDDSPAHPGRAQVFVNPRVLLPLTRREAQVVLTHEATHVATSAPTSPSPDWLVEGFADYVALRVQHLPLRTTAARIAALVRADGVPHRLPGNRLFAAGSPHLEAHYESAWLACRLVAHMAGRRALVSLYRAVDAGRPIDAALRSHAGFGLHSLTQRWRVVLTDLPR